jgi:hypothetical protein
MKRRARRARPKGEGLEGRAMLAITSVSGSLYNSSYLFDRFPNDNLTTPRTATDSTDPPKTFVQDRDMHGAQNLSDTRSTTINFLDYLGESGTYGLTSYASLGSTINAPGGVITSGTIDTVSKLNNNGGGVINVGLDGRSTFTIGFASDTDGYINLKYNDKFTSYNSSYANDPNDPEFGNAYYRFGAEMFLKSSNILNNVYNQGIINDRGFIVPDPHQMNTGTVKLPIKANVPLQITVDSIYDLFSGGSETDTGDGSADLQWDYTSEAPDLAVKVNTGRITPEVDKDLNVYQIIDTEQVLVPIRIENKGTVEAKGPAKATVYLSSTRSLDGDIKVEVAEKPIDKLDLAGGGHLDTVLQGKIDGSGLKVGDEYYFVVQITAPTIRESDAQGGKDANNIAVSGKTFKFMGTPKVNPKADPKMKIVQLFEDGTYYQYVKDTLPGPGHFSAAVEQDPKVNIRDEISFIKAFEGNEPGPYMDTAQTPHPSIGIGMNLDDRGVLAKIKSPLVKAVKAYYSKSKDPRVKSVYKRVISGSEDVVIAVLKSQARAATRSKKPAPAAMTTDDGLKLFKSLLPIYESRAQDALGRTYASLKGEKQVAVVDLAYNAGSVYSSVANALTHKEPILAGFNLVNTLRATQLPLRTEAEYQNLVAERVVDLGRLAVDDWT